MHTAVCCLCDRTGPCQGPASPLRKLPIIMVTSTTAVLRGAMTPARTAQLPGNYLPHPSARLTVPPRFARDKSVVRWPPHINLLYPFHADTGSSFELAAQQAARTVASMPPFQVSLASLRFFNHGRSCTVWLEPSSPGGCVYVCLYVCACAFVCVCMCARASGCVCHRCCAEQEGSANAHGAGGNCG
jgi:hypothetical protein